MLGRFRQKPLSQRLLAGLLALILASNLVSCGDRASDGKNLGIIRTNLAEVAPPEIIGDLRQTSSKYQPRVKIVSPRPDEVLKDTTANIKFQVDGLPIFKDPDLELGSHLNVKVDDRPSQEVYDLKESLVIENLSPGSHTIRVLANTAWNESFKNEGAYEQTTFYILTKGTANKSEKEPPPIAYNSPQGDYSTQPLLLDFYINNSKNRERVSKVKVTINGEEFTLDKPEPIYLQGFKNGNNWVKLEPLDKDGNLIAEPDKDTLGAVNYQSSVESPLAKLLDSNLSVSEALKVVDPKYRPEPVEEVEIPETPTVERSPDLIPSKVQPKDLEKTQPSVPVLPIPPIAPKSELPEKMREDLEKIEPTPTHKLEITPTPIPSESPTPEPKASPKGSFLDRFRRQTETPTPVIETPKPAPVVLPIPTPSAAIEATPIPNIEVTPEVEALPQPSPTGGFLQRLRRSADKSKSVTPPAVVETPVPGVRLEPTPKVLETPEVQPTPASDESEPSRQRSSFPPVSSPTPTVFKTPDLAVEATPIPNFFDRLRNRATPQPEVSPAPTAIETPEVTLPSPTVEESPASSLIERLKRRSSEVETVPTPSAVESPAVEATPVPNFFDRLRNRATPQPEVSPAPTAIETPEVTLPSPTVEESPASSLIERLKRRSSSTEVETAPTPKVVTQPPAFETKPEQTPLTPAFQRSLPEMYVSPSQAEPAPVNDSQNLIERLVPSSTKSMRLETEEGTTEVKAEKLPIIQASPKTNIPSRYFRPSERVEVELDSE